MKPYPLTFIPILKEKVWGGRRLERMGKSLPPGALIGECWELADLSATNVDNTGGSAMRSVIANGEMQGLTLTDAIRAMGPNLMGNLNLSPQGGFPLLVKFLDARENLSVQVHPSPKYAAAHPGQHVKSESWYIIHAEPGAVIYKGLKPGITRDVFERHARDSNIVDDLVAVPAHAGDCHHLPSGTCHALGAGVLVAEVQTPSDTTYRVHDWGRDGRALHVAQAMECITFEPTADESFVRHDAAAQNTRMLVRTDDFVLRELHGLSMSVTSGAAPSVWIALRGKVTIHSVTSEFEPVKLAAGTTTLIPAAIGATRIEATDDALVLEVLLPTH